MTIRNRKSPDGQNKTESGNVFFYVLLGIILFAALAFTVSRGFQSSTTQTLTNREAELATSDILDMAQKLARAVDTVRRKNCSENDVSFSNTIISGYAHSPVVTDKCKVFNKTGGRMSYTAPASKWLDSTKSGQSLYGQWFFTGASAVNSLESTGSELLAILPYVKKEICLEINDRLTIANASSSPPADVSTSYDTTKFTGSFPGTFEILDSGGTSELAGKEAGCFESSSSPASGYHFYYALIAR